MITMPKKLNESEIIKAVQAAFHACDTNMQPLRDEASRAEDAYNKLPFTEDGYEYSTFVSSQVADLVNSDLPALVRVFLGASRPIDFKAANPHDAEAAAEAKDKTTYTQAILAQCDDYYQEMYRALLSIELHPISVITYGVTEQKKTAYKKIHGTPEQIAAAMEMYAQEYDSVEIIELEDEEEEGLKEVELKLLKKESKKPYVRNVSIDNFVYEVSSQGKWDSLVVGEVMTVRRGQLVAEGYSVEQVARIPSASIEQARATGANVFIEQYDVDWASQLVQGFVGYVRLDTNGDGIPELRRVMLYGEELLENEAVNDDPREINYAYGYAQVSTQIADGGKSRASEAIQYQDAMTGLSRAMIDNTAQIAKGRMLVDTSEYSGIEVLDLLGDGTFIRCTPETPGALQTATAPLNFAPIATEALQVIQFLDSQRAQATGSLLANQGLKADTLQKETATRFRGIDDAAQAKVELVNRNVAEILMSQLYAGMAYYAQQYDLPPLPGDNGKMIDPRTWKYESSIAVAVGTGYGDNEKTIATLSLLLQEAKALMGTGLFDAKKLYNIIAKLIAAGGLPTIQDYVNNPEIPEQTLLAENEALKAQLQQLTAQLQQGDALMQVEQVRQMGKAQSEMIQAQQKQQELITNTALKLTELEQKAGKQLDSEFTQNEGAIQ